MPTASLIGHMVEWQPHLLGLSVSFAHQLRVVKDVVSRLQRLPGRRPALAQANALAERIRRAVAAEPIAPLTEAVTSSFGVVERVPGEAAAALLHRADEALYRAKELGRDRVVALPGRAPSAPT